MTNGVDKTNDDRLAIITEQLAKVLVRLEQLQNDNAGLRTEIADLKQYQLNSNDDIKRLTGEIEQMKRQTAEELANVKDELEMQSFETCTCNDFMEQGVTDLVRELTNKTGQVRSDIAEVKRLLKQLAADGTTKAASSEQVAQDHLQTTSGLLLAVENITHQLQRVNKIIGEYNRNSIWSDIDLI